MKPYQLAGILALSFFLFSNSLFSQVKIGGDPKQNPHSSAVLELQSSDRGLLLPRLSQKQMIAIKEPANALLVYNTDDKAIWMYSTEHKSWLPLIHQQQRESIMGLDSCEWVLDSTTARVLLTRGYPLGDSIFYTTDSKKFVFSDRTMNTNSLGQDFPVTQFPGKYYFKGTASRFTDSANLNPSLMNLIFEVDSSGMNSFFRGVQIATVNNPKNNQPLDGIISLSLSTIHSGNDSMFSLTGIANSATVNGAGFTGSLAGITNTTSIRDSATANVQSVFGIRNALVNTSPTSKVIGNAYGYFGSAVLVDTVGGATVQGNLYGVFLSNVVGAAPKRNYAYYSGKGHNRFGDSTLITDGFTTSPRAVLDINSTSAMIIPSGNTVQRPVTGITAMFRNNTDIAAPEYFTGSSWQQLSTGPAEWKFDPATNRVNLVRGLALTDTIFYNTLRKQFVFSDRNTNTNSLGQDFPVESFGAKYTFKATASKRDSTQYNGANVNIVYEIDNTVNSTLYNALTVSAVMNPKSFSHTDLVSGIGNTVIHAGNDSVLQVIGLNNAARNSGNGRSGSVIGIMNATRIQNGTGNNTGELVGIRNLLSRSGATAGRVTGNVYGFHTSITGLTGNVDGNVYGIFISTVSGAGPRKNFAFYSNKGLNRLGDSVLVTDGGAINPRAVLDVNATSAMIIPTGNTAQRPAAATSVTGMVRYNTENGGRLESYNGASWTGTISGSIALDPANMPSNTGQTLSVFFNGATVGSVVAISPGSAPPAGIVIAWARVSAANTIEVRFENNSGAPVNPPSITYNVRVIQ